MPGYNQAAYERQRRTIEDQYAATAASNAYSQTLSQQRGERGIADIRRGFERQFPSFNASFAQRGMAGPGVQSGVHRGALQRYVNDYSRNIAYAQQDVAEQQRQYALTQQNLDAQRQRALADLEAQKQAEIALAALNIQALAPLIGG